jgi:hypothetical protein
MRILFDHSTPWKLARFLRLHTVVSAYEMGWSRLSNGALLKAAEEDAFDALITTDSSISYQQNLKQRKIALIVITGATKWSARRSHVDRIVASVDGCPPSAYIEIDIPWHELL